MAKKRAKAATAVAELPPLAISNLDQADAAVRELAELARLEQKVVSKCNAGIEACKRLCEESLVVDIDGQPTKVTERRAKLIADLEAFACAKRSELFEAGKKSRELNYGLIGFKLSRPSIDFLPAPQVEEGAQPEPSPWEKLKDRILRGLLKCISLMRVGVGELTASVFSVSVSVNRSVVLAKYKAHELNDEQLEKLGLCYCEPRDQFFVEPKVEQVQSHPDDSTSS